MKIYRAIKTNNLSQGFGKDKTYPPMLPVYQALFLLGHDGWDWAVSCKNTLAKTGGVCESVYCDIDGYAIITYIAKDVKTGFGIVAQDQDKDYKHLWWHFDSLNPALKVGSRIGGGDLLGVSGNTGISTGAHLHRALYHWGWQDNGYQGAIDMTQFFTNIFINDYIANIWQQVGLLKKIYDLLLTILQLKK